MGLKEEKKCTFRKNIPHYQLHLNRESIIHLPNKALSPLSYRRHPVIWWFSKCSWQRFETCTLHCSRRLFAKCEAELKSKSQPRSNVTKNLSWGVVQEMRPHKQIVLYGELLRSSFNCHPQFIIHGLSHPGRSEQILTHERGWVEWHEHNRQMSVVLILDTH